VDQGVERSENMVVSNDDVSPRSETGRKIEESSAGYSKSGKGQAKLTCGRHQRAISKTKKHAVSFVAKGV
jgi:hypothetical protein